MHHEFEVDQEKRTGPLTGLAGYDGAEEYRSTPTKFSFTPAETPMFLKKADAIFRRIRRRPVANIEDAQARPANELTLGHAQASAGGSVELEGDSGKFQRAVQRQRQTTLEIV